MTVLRAIVDHGHLVVEDPTDLPEGTLVRLLVADDGDDLDDAERALLDAALDEASDSIQRGDGIDAAVAMQRLRNSR